MSEDMWWFFILIVLGFCHGKPIITPDNHVFHQENGVDFDLFQELRKTRNPNAIYTLFTGDSQLWWSCTSENSGCWLATEELCKNETVDCEQAHGNYSNKVQKISIHSLIEKMSTKPRGLIINGDLTAFGHPHEYEEYLHYWGSPINTVPIYPGLGNHDYANNINDCTLNHCADRMLRWLKDYVWQSFQIRVDIQVESEMMGFYDHYKGSMAYSWDECLKNDLESCVHFIQLNNHPTYITDFEAYGGTNTWDIWSSMNFLKKDLESNKEKPIVINFHDVDNQFSYGKREMKELLLKKTNEYNVLGIFVAHHHDKVGLRCNWCLEGRRVPIIYSGSVPANNYILAKFEMNGRNVSELFKFHVQNENSTVVEELFLNDHCCIFD